MPTKFEPTFAAIKTLSVEFCTPSNNPAYTLSDCAFASLFLAKKSCGRTLKNKSITKFVASMQSSSSNGPIFVDPMSFNFTSDRFTATASAPCILALSFLRFFANFTVPFSKSTTKRGVAPLVFLVVVVSNCSDDAFCSSTFPFVVIAVVVASSPPPSAFVAIFLLRLPPRSVKIAFFFTIASPYLFPEEDEDEEELHEGATKRGAAECEEEEANAKLMLKLCARVR
jgi:hypothetical protein